MCKKGKKVIELRYENYQVGGEAAKDFRCFDVGLYLVIPVG